MDVDIWRKFVREHPAGNVFQSPEMYEVFEKAKNYRPMFFSCFENGVLKGVLLGARICNGRGLFCSMSARCIVWGGPLAENDDMPVVADLLRAFSAQAAKECVYAEFRNLAPPAEELKAVFETVGFSYFPHLNNVVNLAVDEKKLFKGMTAAKRRNVRKAEKNGLVFGQAEKESELNEMYEILKSVYKKTEVPLSDFSFFNAMFNILRPAGLCRFYKVSAAGDIAGVMVVLVNKNSMYEWYVGSSERYYRFRPNEFLVWNVMLEAKKEGLRYFDFGGAGKPGKKYGVRDFKKGFGGDMIEPGRFRKIFRGMAWILGNAAIRMKKIFVSSNHKT